MKQRSVTRASFTMDRRYEQKPPRVFAAFATGKSQQAWFHGPDEPRALSRDQLALEHIEGDRS